MALDVSFLTEGFGGGEDPGFLRCDFNFTQYCSRLGGCKPNSYLGDFSPPLKAGEWFPLEGCVSSPEVPYLRILHFYIQAGGKSGTCDCVCGFLLLVVDWKEIFSAKREYTV